MINELLETREEKNLLNEVEVATDYLVIRPAHSNGKYRISVTKETHKGYFREFLPFAEGNFNYTVGTGRKSTKKLETLDNILNDNKDTLVNMWKENKYQEMVNLLAEEVRNKKLFK